MVLLTDFDEAYDRLTKVPGGTHGGAREKIYKGIAGVAMDVITLVRNRQFGQAAGARGAQGK